MILSTIIDEKENAILNKNFKARNLLLSLLDEIKNKNIFNNLDILDLLIDRKDKLIKAGLMSNKGCNLEMISLIDKCCSPSAYLLDVIKQGIFYYPKGNGNFKDPDKIMKWVDSSTRNSLNDNEKIFIFKKLNDIFSLNR